MPSSAGSAGSTPPDQLLFNRDPPVLDLRGAGVVVPLDWDEVADSDLEPGRFTLRTVRRRLDELDQAADPWADLTRRRYSLTEARSRLDELARSRSTESAGGS